MKVAAALFVALASIFVSCTKGEYVVKVHPPIPPPPPPPPHFKYSSPPIHKGNGGGHRWNSNSLGPPRFHHHHPPLAPGATAVHHHIPHRPTITVHHHGNPIQSLPKPHVHLHHVSPPHHSHPHPAHSPTKGLVHHHHHHHLPPPKIHRPPHPSFKGSWNGGGAFGSSFGKDNFHPSPPDSQQPPVVATHQSVDDNKGPIHTIPAPNLGPSGNHQHHLPAGGHVLSGGGQGGGFQTGHGIGQGAGDDASGGPYPNPVYGKPVTADLTYHEPKVPAHVETEAALSPLIPTITIQSSHAYQVHEQALEEHVTPIPALLGHSAASGSYFAPDPDPSLPAPKVPFTTDPFSHPSNGQSPPDLEQEIPQHLLPIFGLQQQGQQIQFKQPLQPQIQLQLQPQHQPQLHILPQTQLVSGESVAGDYGNLGGQILLAQALAQYDAQTQPDSFQQEVVHQQPSQFSHGQFHIQNLAPVQNQATSVQGTSSVTVQQAPLVAHAHETVYPPSHTQQIGSISDGRGGQLSVYDLFANSPVQSPVLEAIQEDFRHQYPSSTPAPTTLFSPNNQFQYADQFHSTTAAPPQQQFHSTTISPLSHSGGENNFGYQQQQVSSTTPAPPLELANIGNHFGYQQHQFSSTTAAPLEVLSGGGNHLGFQEQRYASTTATPPAAHSPVDNILGYQQQFPSSTVAPSVAYSAIDNHLNYQQQQYPSSTVAPAVAYSGVNNHLTYQQQQFPSTTAAPQVAIAEGDNHFAFQQQGHVYDRGALGVEVGQGVTNLYHELGTSSLNNHRVQGVSVSNPGQAGYIAASYHHQQQSLNPALIAQSLAGFSYGHDSSASGTRESQAVATAGGGEGDLKAGGYPGNLIEGVARKETVRPSSSSSFYSESRAESEVAAKSTGTSNKETSSSAEEDDYYEDPVPQEVDSAEGGSRDRRPVSNPPPVLPSGYGIYETHPSGTGSGGNGNQLQSEEDDRQEQEYDEEEYEDYAGKSNENQGDAPSTRQKDNYDHNVEFGTRLNPKRNQRK